jgi:membrane-bound lytic murein transglycosylase B
MMRIVLTCCFIVLFGAPAWAAQDFSSWLKNFRMEAESQGISQSTLNAALSGVTPISRVIELDRKQPEGTMTFAKYKDRVISQQRINTGRHLLRKHRGELEKAAAKYGVPPQVIVALWGIETSYGDNTGGFKVVDALATLAHDGRRSAFFRKELLNALKIIDAGHISAANMKGSWAGAMGQNQFMPSSFHAYAVDGNGDGKRDIWGSLPDVFSSTANYLSKSGWRADERWGRAVKIPASIRKATPKGKAGTKVKRSLSEWAAMGVTLPDGTPLPVVNGMKGAVVLPGGQAGPAYLVYDNYRVIMRWNNSTYFATSVGLLSDLIAQ